MAAWKPSGGMEKCETWITLRTESVKWDFTKQGEWHLKSRPNAVQDKLQEIPRSFIYRCLSFPFCFFDFVSIRVFAGDSNERRNKFRRKTKPHAHYSELRFLSSRSRSKLSGGKMYSTFEKHNKTKCLSTIRLDWVIKEMFGIVSQFSVSKYFNHFPSPSICQRETWTLLKKLRRNTPLHWPRSQPNHSTKNFE